MVNYGFRVYRVWLREGAGRKGMPWADGDWSYLSHIKDGLGQVKSEQAPCGDGRCPAPLSLWYSRTDLRDLDELPLAPMTNMDDRERRVGRLVKFGVPSRHRLSVEIKTGYVGDFDDALGLEGDRSMQNEAAARNHRAELVVPDRDGNGLLAVESIGRACPVQPITCLLGLASRQVGWAGVVGADGLPQKWWGLKAEQVSDPAFLKELLEADAAEVHLKRTRYDAQGKKKAVDMQVVAKLIDSSELERAKQWLRLPWNARKDMGMKGLVDIIDADEAVLTQLDLNDGYVRVGEGSASAKVRIDDALDMFTYPIDTRQRPSPQAWQDTVRERMSVLDDTLAFD